MKITANITQLKTVSKSDRLLLGALAGQAKIVLDVDLVDPETRSNIGNFTVESESSGGYADAGTTIEPVHLITSEIVQIIKDYM